MIFPFLCAIGKHVWNQAIAHVMRESAQDVAGLEPASRNQGETFEADHCVASPIGEPMVSRDNRAHFVAGSMSAGGFFKSTRRRDHKLVSRKNQLCGKILACFRNRVM